MKNNLNEIFMIPTDIIKDETKTDQIQHLTKKFREKKIN